ncbi:MAG: branched-chain amino acid ABC transporter permease [Atribacterota bacterium]|nr:branched-chain amino acid ABC transporter permease [Atribacterota bacterium]
MNVGTLVQLTVTGLAMGCIYGLVALGINLIYNATGGLNFAQGGLVMLGAYFGVTFTSMINFPSVIGYTIAIIVMGIVGAIFGFLVYEPLRFANPRFFLIAAIGTSIFMVEFVQFIWGKLPYMVPRFIKTAMIRRGSIILDTQNLVIIGGVMIVLFLLHMLLTRTRLGLMMRAVGQDKETSTLMGIRVRNTIRITFAVSTILGTFAGILCSPIFFVSTGMSNIMLKSVAAGVIGGFGSRVYGVVVGGLLVGLVEIYAAFFISSSYRDAWAFIFLIVILVIRPFGLMGTREVGEKA